MKVNRKKILQLLNEKKIPFLLVYGKYDSIIKPTDGRKFAVQVPCVTFVELEKGHRLVKEYLNEPVKNS